MAPAKQEASKFNARVKGNKKLKGAFAASRMWARPDSVLCTNATTSLVLQFSGCLKFQRFMLQETL